VIQVHGLLVAVATSTEEEKSGTRSKGKHRKGGSASSSRASRSRSRSKIRSSSSKGKRAGASSTHADPELLEGLEQLGLGPIPAHAVGDESLLEISPGCTIALGSSDADSELCLVAAVEVASDVSDVRVVLASPLTRSHSANGSSIFLVRGSTDATLGLLRRDLVAFVKNEIVGLAVEMAASAAAES